MFGRFFFSSLVYEYLGWVAQDFYERYALYERQNLHGRLKRPGCFRGLVTVGVVR